jgi:hypothetical protein
MPGLAYLHSRVPSRNGASHEGRYRLPLFIPAFSAYFALITLVIFRALQKQLLFPILSLFSRPSIGHSAVANDTPGFQQPRDRLFLTTSN